MVEQSQQESPWGLHSRTGPLARKSTFEHSSPMRTGLVLETGLPGAREPKSIFQDNLNIKKLLPY